MQVANQAHDRQLVGAERLPERTMLRLTVHWAAELADALGSWKRVECTCSGPECQAERKGRSPVHH